jgi:anti-sigma factor RsiW
MNTPLHVCPDIGEWRGWLDHEVDLSEASRHLETCPACQRLVDELREDSLYAHASLAALAPRQADVPDAADIALARERVQWRHAANGRRKPSDPVRQSRLEPTLVFFSRFSTPWRVAAGGLAAAVALTLVVAFTPEGNSAAAAFLAQFRSQQVQAIEITPQSQGDIVKAFNSLSNLGTLQTTSVTGATTPLSAAGALAQQARTVTAAQAASTVGFPLLLPDPASLPNGIADTPTVKVSPASQVRFTFDTTKARAYYQKAGHPEVNLPDKFNGATLSVSLPPAALVSYGGGGKNEVVLAEAGELVVDVQGNVSLPEMRDFLLSLPGLPPAVVGQLKQIQSWNDTLPIPVPVDQVNWKKVKIHGSDGLLLDDNSGVGSAAIWHADGHLYGVAGNLKATELKKVAESLAVR